MVAMTDQTQPPVPPPGFVDLHARLAGARDPLRHVPQPGLAGRHRDGRPGGLRLGDHRPRARRRHRGRPPREPVRHRRHADRRARPAAIRGAAPHRSCPRPRGARDHGSPRRHPRAGARGGLVHALRARRRPRARARHARGGTRRACAWRRPRRSTPGSSASSRSNRGARSIRPRRSPPSMASTSCSSARPTCRMPSGCRASSPTRLRRGDHVGRRRSRGGRQDGRASSSATPSAVARHRDLGFRFIGLGSDGAFVADGARAVLREAGRV